VLFDLPVKQNALRNRLRKELRRRGFGCLQRSVWITPDPLDEQTRALLRTEIDVRSLTIFEGHPAAGESDEEIARAAWDFVGINRAYEKQRKLLEEAPLSRSPTERDARTLRTWARAERAGWLAAVTVDPMLPQPLLPPGYLGKETWELRIKVLGKAGRTVAIIHTGKNRPIECALSRRRGGSDGLKVVPKTARVRADALRTRSA
jgi:DNA-binding transcriptional regulator PaaX